MIVVLTFDCYGTLVDWEKGITQFFMQSLQIPQQNACEMFEKWERAQFKIISSGYKPYHEVMKEALNKILCEMGIAAEEYLYDRFVNSIPSWPLFDDLAALKQFEGKLKIGILSNMDEQPLQATIKRFPFKIDFVVSADWVCSYKPDLAHFKRALQIVSCPANQICHCAFGFEYDLLPAHLVGMKTILVQRKLICCKDVKPNLIVSTLYELEQAIKSIV